MTENVVHWAYDSKVLVTLPHASRSEVALWFQERLGLRCEEPRAASPRQGLRVRQVFQVVRGAEALKESLRRSPPAGALRSTRCRCGAVL